MRVLGIDPGIASTGWGVIDHVHGRLHPVAYGTVATNTDQNTETRILPITQAIKGIIDQYQPKSMSIEDIFFLRNVSSAIPVAKVIGSVLYLTSLQEISFSCYTPLQIKLALTGMGKAQKHQVARMTAMILGLKDGEISDHVSDALAAAVCHIHTVQGTRGMPR